MKDVLMDVVLPVGGSLLGGVLLTLTAVGGIQKWKDGHVHLFSCSYSKENIEAYLKSFKDDNDGKTAKNTALDAIVGVGAVNGKVTALAAQKAQNIASTFDGLTQEEKNKATFAGLTQEEKNKATFAGLTQAEKDKATFAGLTQAEKNKATFAGLTQEEKNKVAFADLAQAQKDAIKIANLPAPEKDKLNGADSLYTKLRAVTSTSNTIGADFTDGAGNKSIADVIDSGKGFDELGGNCKTFVQEAAKNAGFDDNEGGAKAFLAAISAIKA